MRIRSIKPEFWRSEDISDLSIFDRLLFIGLWSYVDDSGTGMDRVSLIAADLFAEDLSRNPRECLASIAEGLSTLANKGLIVRFTHDGRDYLDIARWGDHQRIDRPNKKRYPRSDDENAVIREGLATSSRVSRETPSSGTGEQRSSGSVDQWIGGAGEAPDLNETEGGKTKDGSTTPSPSDSAPAPDNSASSSRNQEPVVDTSDTKKEPSIASLGKRMGYGTPSDPEPDSLAHLPYEERKRITLELAAQQRKEQSA